MKSKIKTAAFALAAAVAVYLLIKTNIPQP